MRRGSVEGLAGAIVQALLESDALGRARSISASNAVRASPGGARTGPRRGSPTRAPAAAAGREAGLAALVASRIVARLGGGGGDDGELPLDRIEI